MFLIVDANVFFSALISKGRTFRLFEFNSLIKLFELVAPEFLKDELKEHIEEVVDKSKLTKAELERVFELLQKEVSFIPSSIFSEFLEESKKISPTDDFPYVALALKIKSLGLEVAIWSNDNELKEALRNKIKVFSTDELWSFFFEEK
ncbi:MAG: PIN domain-containing protein [Thermoproteota archaeon]